MDDYYIFSIEHNSWWAANHNGYVSSIKNAGLYSKEEALKTCNGANYDWDTDSLRTPPNELPVHRNIAESLEHKVFGKEIK